MNINGRKINIDSAVILKALAPHLRENGITDSMESIISKSHRAELVYARALIARALHKAGLTVEQIASIVKRHHATVLYLIQEYAMPKKFNHSLGKTTATEISNYTVIQYHQSQIEFHQTEIKKLQSNGVNEPAT